MSKETTATPSNPKCYKCKRSAITCICQHLRPLQTNTRFIILMHPKEYKKERNGTGHMTRLQLENSEIIVGVDFTNHQRVNEILAKQKDNSFLLYPGKNSFNLSISKNTATSAFLGKAPHLFLLDGTWPCVRKMLKLSKNLQKLKRVSFDNTIKSKFIIKQQPAPLCLSTIESAYTVLNLLKKSNLEDCETQDFLIPFEKMIALQLEYMLSSDYVSYRSLTNSAVSPKDRYKKNPQRSIVFEKETK